MFDSLFISPEGHLFAAWMGIVLGLTSGAMIGLGFQDDAWLGGYASWRRRMLRLGHISFFGIGFLNLAYSFTMPRVFTGDLVSPGLLSYATGWGLVAGAVLMPTVCFLSAWREPWRHAFVLPVACLLGASLSVTVKLLLEVVL